VPDDSTQEEEVRGRFKERAPQKPMLEEDGGGSWAMGEWQTGAERSGKMGGDQGAGWRAGDRRSAILPQQSPLVQQQALLQAPARKARGSEEQRGDDERAAGDELGEVHDETGAATGAHAGEARGAKERHGAGPGKLSGIRRQMTPLAESLAGFIAETPEVGAQDARPRRAGAGSGEGGASAGRLLCGGRLPCAVASAVHVDANDDHSSETASWSKVSVESKEHREQQQQQPPPPAPEKAARRAGTGRPLFDFAAGSSVPVAITAEALLGGAASSAAAPRSGRTVCTGGAGALVPVPEKSGHEIKEEGEEGEEAAVAAADYVGWLHSTLDAALPGKQPSPWLQVGIATAAAAPAASEAFHTPEDDGRIASSDLHKQLAVVRERVQATEAQVVALKTLLTASATEALLSPPAVKLPGLSAASGLQQEGKNLEEEEQECIRLEKECRDLEATALSEQAAAAAKSAHATAQEPSANLPTRKASAGV